MDTLYSINSQLSPRDLYPEEKNVPDEEATSCRNCDFKVSGKVKPSKSRQKLKAHREKHHMAHVAVDEEIGSDMGSESLIPVYADTGLDVIPVFDDESEKV